MGHFDIEAEENIRDNRGIPRQSKHTHVRRS
jgi:hypothetical protein